MKIRRFSRAAMVLATVWMVSALPAWTQAPTGAAGTAGAATTPVAPANPAASEPADKKSCDPPEFSFAWLGYDQVQLTAKADPEQSLIVSLAYLETRRSGEFEPIDLHPAFAMGASAECNAFQPHGNGLEEALEFCLPASPNGSTASFFMDRAALLKAGGFVSLKYRALPGELATVCAKRKAGPENPTVRVIEKHTLNFDVGSVFNLKGGGGWKTNGEAAMAEDSRWRTWAQSGFSLRYSALDSTQDAGDGMDDNSGGSKAEPGDGKEEEPFNPFTQGGGLLETNVYLLLTPLHFLPRLGVVGGWGLSSIPGGADSALQTRQRHFVGIRETIGAINAGRNGDSFQNAQGYIQAAFARDRLWDRVEVEPATDSTPAVFSDESDRFFFEGEIEVPRIGSEWFHIDLRFFASIPRSGDGPSDLRVSALASMDPLKWFPGLDKKGK